MSCDPQEEAPQQGREAEPVSPLSGAGPALAGGHAALVLLRAKRDKVLGTPPQHLVYGLPDIDTQVLARTGLPPQCPLKALHPGTPCPGHCSPSTGFALTTAGHGTDNSLPEVPHLIKSP